MRWSLPGYGGERLLPEKVKQDGWREQSLLAVSVDDQRLSPSGSSFARSAKSSMATNRNADRVGREPEPMRLPPPSPAAISRMEEALL